jgi:hypothetical protein
MSGGNRRSDADVATNRARVLELIATEGMTATEAARELGIPERTARRLVGKARPEKRPEVICAPDNSELGRRRRWELEKDAQQRMENGCKLTLRPGAAARRRQIERFGFEMVSGEFPRE